MTSKLPQFEFFPGKVYWKDMHGVFQGCNADMASLLGLHSPAEIVGMTDKDLMWGDSEFTQANIDLEVIKTGSEKKNLEIKKLADGRSVEFLVIRKPYTDTRQKVIGMYAIFIDFEFNKGTTKDNKLSKIYLDNILLNLPVAIYWLDPQGVILGCNEVEAKMFGFNSPEEMTGMNIYDLEKLCNWDEKVTKALYKNNNEVMSTQQRITNEETVTTPDGKLRSYLSYKAPMHDANRKVIGLIGISTEITELKEAEKKISQANASKASFLNAIDHMIRNPLSGILGSAQLLEHDKITEKQAEITRTIVDSTKEITSTLERVRSYLDLEEGSLENIYRTFILKDFFETFVNKYKSLAEEKSLAFIFEYNSILPDWVRGNSTYLSQILHNLLSNAVKYTSKGNIKLIVDLYGFLDEEVTLSILIEDTGQGIRKENQSCLFNLFNQYLAPTEEFSEPGLSLSISAKMIEIMGGAISVKSVVDQGTIFSLRVPLIKVEKQLENPNINYNYSQKTVKSKLRRDKKSLIKVLLIEDNPISLRVLKMMLEKNYHCEVEGVYNLKDAMKKDASLYEIIFVDINLPDGTGIDFIKFWKQKLKDKSTPMVAVTSHVAEEEKIAMIEAGAVDVIAKPVDMKVLTLVVDAYVFEDNRYVE